jgi:hypothetical protein
VTRKNNIQNKSKIVFFLKADMIAPIAKISAPKLE